MVAGLHCYYWSFKKKLETASKSIKYHAKVRGSGYHVPHGKQAAAGG